MRGSVQLIGQLVAKDLRILRRSPLLVALLFIYPAVLAILIGVALSKGPDRPRVAFLNEIPRASTSFTIAGKKINTRRYTRELFESIDPVKVKSRSEAIEKVRSGQALAALIVPPDLPQKLQSQLRQPELDVYVNQEDPLKAKLADNTINSQVSKANLAISSSFTKIALGYANLLLDGGTVNFLGQKIEVLGLKPSEKIMSSVAKTLPPGSKDRRELEQVAKFARFAVDNFDLSDDAISAIRQPIKLNKHVVSGSTPSLTTFATALALAISLMFVTVILTAAGLALEREEGVYLRLVRGRATATTILLSKLTLGLIASFSLALVMVVVLQLFVSLDWSRAWIWPLAVATASTAFAAFGLALGAVAREIRAATLLAVLVSLPFAFLALVPSGVVTGGLHQLINIADAIFPFKASVDALVRAFYGSGPSLYLTVAHLLALAALFFGSARLALTRFK